MLLYIQIIYIPMALSSIAEAELSPAEIGELPQQGVLLNSGITTEALSGEVSPSSAGNLDFLIPPRLRGLYLAEGYGLDLSGVHVSLEGHLLGQGVDLSAGIEETFQELKDIGIEPYLEVYASEATLTEDLASKLGTSLDGMQNARIAVLYDRKTSKLGRVKNEPLGYVRLNLTGGDVSLPQNVEIRILENNNGRKTAEPALLLTNQVLRTLAIGELDASFREALGSEVDPVILDHEKVQLLAQLETLLSDCSEGFSLSEADEQFLREFRNTITSGDYDDVLANAWKDTAISVASTQLLAVASPFVGAAVGSATKNPAIGAGVGGGLYTLAPIPSWIYILAERGWRPSRRLSSFLQFGGSFLAMHLPLGSLAAFPLSISLQKQEELAHFKNLVYSHPKLKDEISWRRRVADFFLYHGQDHSFREDDKAIVNQHHESGNVEDKREEGVILEMFFNGGEAGVEAVIARNPQDKAAAAEFVAREYISHKLSSPEDADIENVGTQENPVYAVKEYEGCETDWLIVRDRETKQIVITGKMIKRPNNGRLPMQVELEERAQRVTEGKSEGMEFTSGDLSSINDLSFEMGRVAFDIDMYGDTRKDIKSAWKYSLALLTWVRGIYLYMEQNNVDQFGAVMSVPAARYLKKLGELGLEAQTKPFFYLPQDEETHMPSRIEIINFERAKAKMREENPAVYKFVIENQINDAVVRKNIWDSIVARMNAPKPNDGVLDTVVKALKKRAAGRVWKRSIAAM